MRTSGQNTSLIYLNKLEGVLLSWVTRLLHVHETIHVDKP
jgi:hypothetical protein